MWAWFRNVRKIRKPFTRGSVTTVGAVAFDVRKQFTEEQVEANFIQLEGGELLVLKGALNGYGFVDGISLRKEDHG